MRFSLTIDCDNAAFAPCESNPAKITRGMRTEVRRILDVASDAIAAGEYDKSLRDSNGNTVGSFNFYSDN